MSYMWQGAVHLRKIIFSRKPLPDFRRGGVCVFFLQFYAILFLMRERRIRTTYEGSILFRITCHFGKQIEISRSYWHVISHIKHPSIAARQSDIQETLQSPDEIRQSIKGNKVFLYYRRYGTRYLCVIARHQNGKGFIITVYTTKKIKEGTLLWQKRRNK